VVVPSGATIVAGVDLDVSGVGLTVIAGPSGSGKSTLLRLCNRLGVPTEGRVLLDGVDIATLDPLVLRRRAGMVFQRPVTFAGTVRDNLQVADPHAAEARLASQLERVALGAAFLDRQADDLSGGEAQRMCIARALLTDPEVLLLDEATSSLDSEARLVVEQLVRGLVDAGDLVALWVTHDLDQARRIADRTVVMQAGSIVAETEAARYLQAAAERAAGPEADPRGRLDARPDAGPDAGPETGPDTRPDDRAGGASDADTAAPPLVTEDQP
jgi:putative ABC transport system ATP-binding protein